MGVLQQLQVVVVPVGVWSTLLTMEHQRDRLERGRPLSRICSSPCAAGSSSVQRKWPGNI